LPRRVACRMLISSILAASITASQHASIDPTICSYRASRSSSSGMRYALAVGDARNGRCPGVQAHIRHHHGSRQRTLTRFVNTEHATLLVLKLH
jgi:hypothetical protein